MKKIILLYATILFFSCESLGVNEFTDQLSYYEYVGFGWTHFFDKNYITAIEYFQTAIDIDEVEYINSANVGKAWTYLMMSNQSIGYSNATKTARRDSAEALFVLSKQNYFEASELYEECEYTFCCNDCFIDDYEVGIIYGDVSDYLSEEDEALTYEILVTKISEFITDHSDEETLYDFNDGKPNAGHFNLSTNSLIFLLAQLHFFNDKVYESCILLENNNLCSDIENFDLIECDENEMTFESLDLILTCMDRYTPLN